MDRPDVQCASSCNEEVSLPAVFGKLMMGRLSITNPRHKIGCSQSQSLSPPTAQMRAAVMPVLRPVQPLWHQLVASQASQQKADSFLFHRQLHREAC